MSASTGAGGLNLEVIEAVSWDVDGTLYSTRRLRALLLWRTASSWTRHDDAVSLGDLVRLRRFYRRAELARSADGVWKPSGQDLERRLALERPLLEPALASVGPRPGVAELLRFFRQRCRSQVAVSDFECGYKLGSLGFGGQFDRIYVGERLGAIKPNPQLLRKVIRDLGIQPNRLLHIGDRSDTDGVAARAAGCQVLLIGRDFRSFPELLRRLSGTSFRTGR